MSNDIREFLSRVLPWPGDDGRGFVNVHIMGKRDGKTFWSGTPTTDVDGFLRAVNGYLSWQTKPDIYMCMSRQAQTKPKDDGTIRAAKSREHAMYLKALYWDVDVKDTAYKTLGEALDAITACIASQPGLPSPSALVMSGGGVHVYWISKTSLTPDEWQPYADALKEVARNFGLLCDLGVTGDSARVLRVPGTYNCKTHPYRPVKLLGLVKDDYDFPTDLACLKSVVAKAALPPASPCFDPALFSPGKIAPVLAALPLESLADGITRELPPLDPHNMLKECPHFMGALETGGRDFGQGLWMLTTLACTWLENGNAIAHAAANGHPGYSQDETQKLWERKVLERQSHDIGWPSCKAFQNEGCKSCAGCKHINSGKSPLHFTGPAPKIYVPAAASNRLGLVPLTDADLPVGYKMINNIVHKIATKRTDSGPDETTYLPLFQCAIYNPRSSKNGDNHFLSFMAAADGGHVLPVTLATEDFPTDTLVKRLYKQVVMIEPDNKKHLEKFIVSFLNKLHVAAEATMARPLGWIEPDEKTKTFQGFSYGGVVYRPNGSTMSAGYLDKELARQYNPKGRLGVWFEACAMITAQRLPELEVIVASAFAAPLMVAVGEYGCLMNVFGDSGAGKTTALRVGSAVWGHPKFKEAVKSTSKSVLNKMGQIRNLPIYWDEIGDAKTQAQVSGMLFESSMGVEHSRLKQTIEQQFRGDWQTLVIACSNPCFGDHLAKISPDSNAALMRVLEYKVARKERGSEGWLRPVDASTIHTALDYNYGRMGEVYAQHLATNWPEIDKFTKDWTRYYTDKMALGQEERYWAAIAGALVSGAQIANGLGCGFDLERMVAFLEETITWNRYRNKDEDVEGGTVSHTETVLTNFLKAYVGSTLRTTSNGTWITVDAPYPLPGHATQVQWDMGTNELRFSRSEFNLWLKRHNQNSSPRLVMGGLNKHFKATVGRGQLGARTPYRSGQEQLVTVPVTPQSSLWSMMTTKTAEAEEQVA